jgi:plasmid stabilization system protein ParE
VKRVTYLIIAEIELAEAAQYYNNQQSGLGKTFLEAVRAAEERIQRHPEAWALHGKPVRGCRVAPFPHRMLYRELPDRIQVVAVAHPSRRPGYWKNRLS